LTHNVGDDLQAVLLFIVSKELSRVYRLYDKCCRLGNAKLRDLLVEEINFLTCVIHGHPRYNPDGTDNTGYVSNMPERVDGEIQRVKNKVIHRRKPETLYDSQEDS